MEMSADQRWEERKKKRKRINLILIVIGISLVFIAAVLVISEIEGAKEFCKSINGKYEFKAVSMPHYCDNKSIFSYSDGWDFERIDLTSMKNISIILPKK